MLSIAATGVEESLAAGEMPWTVDGLVLAGGAFTLALDTTAEERGMLLLTYTDAELERTADEVAIDELMEVVGALDVDDARTVEIVLDDDALELVEAEVAGQ
ncbi:hypothetical protein HDU93_000271 [Gonapodya sp. JEL0774]|nr:hypothetical protein HDU93_000271 [Gonapodya sp. JEL0774]